MPLKTAKQNSDVGFPENQRQKSHGKFTFAWFALHRLLLKGRHAMQLCISDLQVCGSITYLDVH
jgi:hypothetical protein